MRATTHFPDYRPYIDGLRAIAVLSVVLFHAFPAALPGGYIGVDIFFVISGFLISGIILKDIDQGSFKITDFYARRIKRIFPALLTVLTACMVFGWFTLFADEYAHLGKHVGAGVAFVSNFTLLGESSYFDVASDIKPLLHLWSLGIEEQFYLIWPALIMLAAIKGRRAIWWVLCATLAASLVANLLIIDHSREAAFYLSVTRVWELLIGAVLAYIGSLRELPPFLAKFIGAAKNVAPSLHKIYSSRDLWAGTGLMLVGIALSTFDRYTVFPGWSALLPTLGAALLIAAGSDAWVNRHLLSKPFIVFIGLISYPLYLWHWPILSFTRIIESGAIGHLVIAGAVVASFALAIITYRYVETPFRTNRTPRTVLMLLTVGVLVGTVGVQTFRQDGLTTRSIEAKSHFNGQGIMADRKQTMRLQVCHYLTDTQLFSDFLAAAGECLVLDAARKNILVIGDSHAADLWASLSKAYPDTHFLQMTGSGCHPIEKKYLGEPAGGCGSLNRLAKYEFPDLKKVDGIILTARWLDDFSDVMDDIRYYRALDIPVAVFGPTFEFTADVLKIVKRIRFKDNLDISQYGAEHVFNREVTMQNFFDQQSVP